MNLPTIAEINDDYPFLKEVTNNEYNLIFL